MSGVAVSVVVGAIASIVLVSLSVSCGGALLKSTRACASIFAPVAAVVFGVTVNDTKPAPAPSSVFGGSKPLLGSSITSPVSGSIAWKSHVAVPDA